MRTVANLIRRLSLSSLFFCALSVIVNSQTIQVFNTSNSGIADNVVRAIFIDSYNAKWVATDKGLCRFDGNTWTIYTTANKIGDGPINDLALQRTKFYGDELWIATSKGASVAAFGIDGISAATNYTKSAFPMLSDSIVAVAVDSTGTRYFASVNGITWFKGNKWGIITHDSMPNSIPSDPILTLFAHNDSLFIGTKGYGMAHGGVGRIQMKVDGVSGASIIQGPYCGNLNNAVRSIYIDSKARQWFGTEGGLFEHQGQIFKGEGWLRFLSREEGLCGDTIYAIAESPQKTLWIGTNGGLNVISNDNLYSLNKAKGLVADVIFDIAFDTLGNGWLATNKGLVKVQADFYTGTKKLSYPENIKVQVFPNPTHGKITIQLPEENTLALITFFDMNGRMLFSQTVTSYKIDLDLSSRIKKGIYYMQIQTKSNVTVQKVLLY
ncbi:MAG: T9SS type A sorting domain-containing protein [Bacteroidales bacterium]|nr:T9SS type A sorting domain-containing protein [Bacteroidales bacterium]